MGFIFWNTAWNGQRIGDFMWASIWCREAQNVRGLYAEIMGYLICHCLSADPTLYVLALHSSTLWEYARNLASCWLVFLYVFGLLLGEFIIAVNFFY